MAIAILFCLSIGSLLFCIERVKVFRIIDERRRNRFLTDPADLPPIRKTKTVAIMWMMLTAFFVSCLLYVIVFSFGYMYICGSGKVSYFECEYFSVQTLTSVGYGMNLKTAEVSSVVPAFHKMAIAAMLFGGLTWTFGIGIVLSAVTEAFKPDD